MKRRNFFKALAGAIGAGPVLVKAAAKADPAPVASPAIALQASGAVERVLIDGKEATKLKIISYGLVPGSSWSKEVSEQTVDSEKFRCLVFTNIETRS